MEGRGWIREERNGEGEGIGEGQKTAEVSCIRTSTANTFLLLFATDCV